MVYKISSDDESADILCGGLTGHSPEAFKSADASLLLHVL